MNNLKRFWPYLLAVLVFAVVACLYMSPALNGKVIASTDGVQARAAQHEGMAYFEETGNRTWWTGSMFSGMPNYQIGGGRFTSDDWTAPFKKVLLSGHKSVIAIVFIYFMAFFALMRSMKVDKCISIVGALAIAFSSYFFIIIGANHHTKTSSLALMSVVVAGFYLIYNGHRKTGVVLTLLCTSAGLYPHPQMAYYICFIIGFFFFAELTKAVINKSWKAFCISTLIFSASFVIGAGTGTAATFTNLEYADETMRGGHSDLVKSSDTDNKTKGLDLDYATAWSYGIDECWTFLVPDYMGGSSSYNVGSDSELCKDMIKQGVPKKQAEQFCKNVPTYWGDQPFTSGPVYMGAIVCMLFILGLFIVKGPYKWALLIVTLLSVMLSWGYHFMGLTRFFFDNVPMYNKFRTVSSILVIAEITMPLLGFLALQSLVEAKRAGKDLSKKVITAGGIVIALVLVCLMFTSGFEGRSDAQMPEWLTPMLIDARRAMFAADCWRSIIFVALGTAVVWFYTKSQKFTTPLLAIVLGVLVLADMWPVAKRFMNDSHFSQGNAYDKEFKMQPWEKQILDSDKDPNFRVFNLTVSPFNDARTSYYLKSIGGYSAAKLRRYQDLIDQHLSKMHMPVINMLNTKYIIVPDQQTGSPVVQYNPDAMGNAWFVEKIIEAKTPNEECDMLMTLDLHREAVVGSDYINNVKDLNPGADSLAHISLTKYTPEYIEYDAECSKPGTVIFSEIFYPHGWKAIVDGKPAELYRANYMLRAMNIETGKHHIRLEFRPESVDKGNVISMTFVVLMYLIIAGILLSNLRKSKVKD
ncbi:MAG: YfhO family protein [Bacteroidales bacterium]|nr:YfhO family protein [Bacteroidales bacterium]